MSINRINLAYLKEVFYQKDDKRNLILATFHMIAITLICMSLGDLTWFTIDGNVCVPYLTLGQFFWFGYVKGINYNVLFIMTTVTEVASGQWVAVPQPARRVAALSTPIDHSWDTSSWAAPSTTNSTPNDHSWDTPSWDAVPQPSRLVAAFSTPIDYSWDTCSPSQTYNPQLYVLERSIIRCPPPKMTKSQKKAFRQSERERWARFN